MERHGLASSVIYTWRKQARQGHFSVGRSGMFAPVAIVEPQADVTSESAVCVAVAQDLEQGPLQYDPIVPEPADPAPQSDGTAMVVALPDGVRILINNGVDEGALGKVLRALGR
jgi:hypothetical protein